MATATSSAPRGAFFSGGFSIRFVAGVTRDTFHVSPRRTGQASAVRSTGEEGAGGSGGLVTAPCRAAGQL